MRPDVRVDQLGRPTGDVFDERLPPGTLGVEPGQDWTLVATVTGLYGISCGSHSSSNPICRSSSRKQTGSTGFARSSGRVTRSVCPIASRYTDTS